VVALLDMNGNGGTFHEVAAYLTNRSLYKAGSSNEHIAEHIRKLVCEEEQPTANLLLANVEGYVFLRTPARELGFTTFNAVELANEEVRSYFEPPPVLLNVFDINMNTQRKASFYAQKIVCVLTRKLEFKSPKGRNTSGVKKFIYVKESDAAGKESISIYNINISLEKFQKKVDPLNHWLVNVSDSILVNVAYFKEGKDGQLVTELSYKEIKYLPVIRFSNSSKAKLFKSNFQLIRNHYEERFWLKKRLLG